MIRANQKTRLEQIGLIIDPQFEYAQCPACFTKFQNESVAEKHIELCQKIKKQKAKEEGRPFSQRFDDKGHLLGVLYYRIKPRHSGSELKRIKGLFFCPVENKLFRETVEEIKT